MDHLLILKLSRTPRRSCRAARGAKHLPNCAAAIRRRLLRGCDPPEALISDAGLYPMSEKSFILRIHLMIETTRILRQRLK